MRKVIYEDSWPAAWKYSYHYDLQEVYGVVTRRGYAYAYANRLRYTIALVLSATKPPATVLDVAAAQGNFSLKLAELGYDVTWNDLRSDLAKYVALKYEVGNIRYEPGNVFELRCQECFDVVLITEVIEHVAHPDAFLETVAKFVKPGGHIIMTTPNGEYFRNKLPKFSECKDASVFEKLQFRPDADGHIFLLHAHEIESLAQKADLKIKEIRLFTNPLTNGHLKLEILLKLLPEKLVNCIESITSALPNRIKRKLHTQIGVLFEKMER